MSITLIIISKNKISTPDWVSSCSTINEVIIDTESDFPLNNDFSAKRNHCLEIAKNDWCLFLDTDETPSASFIDKINHFDNHQYAFRRIDIFLGKKLNFGETGHFYITRLVNRKMGKFIGKVHERWQTDKPIIKSNTPIIHNSHQTFYGFIEKINHYSEIRAKELSDLKTKTGIFQIIFYTKAKFFQNYILRLGFLDGIQGLINALGMSLHSFLVRSKLWSMQQP
jgi:hypothetical protein